MPLFTTILRKQNEHISSYGEYVKEHFYDSTSRYFSAISIRIKPKGI